MANYNGLAQTVIAGHKGAVDRAVALAKERGARKATLLAVSAPFHSPLMRPAREGMAPLLAATDFRDPRVPVVTNVDAAPVTTGDAARDALVRQIDSPVRWVESVLGMEEAFGVETFVEVGPGNVLTGLTERIAKTARTTAVTRPGPAAAAPGGDGRRRELMFKLDGKTALVTGASQGIGEAIARVLARQGARVVLAARNEDKLKALAAEIDEAGGQALPLVLDVTQPETFGERLKSLPEDFAAIDILVNNAGITADNLLARMSLEDWERVLRTNLTGAFALTKEVMRGMMKRRWGRIINVSSVVGLMGNAGQANYAAAKAGLIGFTKSLARELGSRNITVNVVAPGYIADGDDREAARGLARGARRGDRPQAAGHGGRRRRGGALPGQRGGGLRHRPRAERIGWPVHLRSNI